MQSDEDKSAIGTRSLDEISTACTSPRPTGGNNKEHSKETLSNVALFLGEVRDGLTMVCSNV